MHGASDFTLLCPSGYFIALRIGFAFPLVEHNLLPKDWVNHYTSENYMIADPVVRWLYSNSGHIRWSDIRLPDPRGVIEAAKRFGLGYGVAISLHDPGTEGQRSFGNFTRADREFTDTEISQLSARLWRLHVSLAPPTNLTEAELEALKMIKDGLLIKEIAARLGVSEGAVKQRIKSAKIKLRAKTSSQAVSAATGYGLI